MSVETEFKTSREGEHAKRRKKERDSTQWKAQSKAVRLGLGAPEESTPWTGDDAHKLRGLNKTTKALEHIDVG